MRVEVTLEHQIEHLLRERATPAFREAHTNIKVRSEVIQDMRDKSYKKRLFIEGFLPEVEELQEILQALPVPQPTQPRYASEERVTEVSSVRAQFQRDAGS